MVMTLLIIDDEPNMLHMLENVLKSRGYDITTATSGEEGLKLVKRQKFDFILCDIRMPQIDGMEFLKIGKKFIDHSTVIMMSAYGTVDMAIEAMKNGAYDFISKPFKSDEVLITLKKAEERETLKKENNQLKFIINSYENTKGIEDMIGDSPPIKKIYKLINKVAEYDTSVLVTGESGTGKELVAKGIHYKSGRSKSELITVNCGSIPLSLMESEFFGHTKGAFTGADKDKKGLFEIADGSTLFLDEIGELPAELQVKLLRVLQEGEVRAVGSNITKKIDVRIIAATSKNLNKESREGNFRQDLLFRINVVEIFVPPLRERSTDIPKLVDHFITKYRSKMNSQVIGVHKSVLSTFADYSWPGNVRELENAIEHSMIYSDGDLIMVEDLPTRLKSTDSRQSKFQLTSKSLSIKQNKKELETNLIDNALKATKGNKSQASLLLEISYPSLLKKIQEYDL